MKHGGFSIIEIVIVITVLGILLGLSVVSMSASQVNSRDAERKADVEAISIYLESYFSSKSVTQGQTRYFNGKTYPDNVIIQSQSHMQQAFADVDSMILRAPGVKEDQPISLIAATNATQTTVDVAPQPTTTQYVYQPLTRNKTLCTDFNSVGACVKFNIFYRLEKDNSIKMITSKNQ